MIYYIEVVICLIVLGIKIICIVYTCTSTVYELVNVLSINDNHVHNTIINILIYNDFIVIEKVICFLSKLIVFNCVLFFFLNERINIYVVNLVFFLNCKHIIIFIKSKTICIYLCFRYIGIRLNSQYWCINLFQHLHHFVVKVKMLFINFFKLFIQLIVLLIHFLESLIKFLIVFIKFFPLLIQFLELFFNLLYGFLITFSVGTFCFNF